LDPSADTGELLALAKRLHGQERREKGKLYSVHADRRGGVHIQGQGP
jgi:hypothetical protein